MTRKEARREFADLLKAELGDLVNAVYSGQVGDFGKARAVIVVSSAGTVPQIIARKNYIGRHDIAVDIFVLYADPDANWDEEKAEDLLDDISEKVLHTLEQHPTGNNWSALDWLEPSQTIPTEIGGVDYRREQIILKPS